MSQFSDDAKHMHKIFMAHLKECRQDEGLTMRAIAERLGTPHSFIGKIEQQGRRLDIAEFVLYCEGLGRDPRATFDTMLHLAGK